MATTNNPRGLVEYRKLGSGHCNTQTRWRRVKADSASGAHQKFAGDPVVLVSGDTVARIPVAQTAASLPILGVIRAVYNSDKRPLTHNLPSTGNFIPASTAGWVEVNEDPNQTYLCNTDATVVSTYIGQYVELTANTPNTAAGRSGFSVEVATGTNTAAATVPFQIVGLGPENIDGTVAGGDNNQDVEIVIYNHVWRNTNRSR